jgi:hypothetical protein
MHGGKTSGKRRRGESFRRVLSKPVGTRRARRYAAASSRRKRRPAMAKGQVRKNKEARKPKAEKKKTIAANPSTKGTVLGTKS